MARLMRQTAVLLLVCLPGLMWAQSTATVNGTVVDRTGAVIPRAQVEFSNQAAGIVRTASTGETGSFTLTNVPAGVYRVTASAPGFKIAVDPAVRLEVGRSHALTLQLDVGQVTESVEVRSTGAELQTLDASVGNVFAGDELRNAPILGRDATSILLIQPMAIPGFNTSPGTGEGNLTGGQVAGARSDQNTFMLDGGDATSNTEASGGYNTGFTATPRAVVPTPAESLEELRVITNNAPASFGQSAGAAVQMVTRRGTNNLHGAAYWYHQNDNINANTWTRNLLGQPNPEMRDNRYGGRLGGPIMRDRTFLFVHYEGRRFLRNEDFTRLVPSAEMRQGILRFRDADGNIINYDLATAACAGGACDPRGLGLNPVVSQIWNQFMPLGNNPTAAGADGLNTLGFTAPVPFVVKEDFVVARLDHKVSDDWDFMSSFRYSVTDAASTAQVDIGGITGGQLGVPRATNSRPLQPRYLIAGLTGRITSNLTNDFRFNYLRHWWQWQPVSPFPQVVGTDAALAIAGESRTAGLVPVNVDTQNARARTWNGKDYTFNNNTTWLRGKHLFQFGGRYTRQDLFHQRDDKVVGGLTNPVYQVNTGTFFRVPEANRPSICGGGVTSNCLQAGDAGRWNSFYAAVLGIVDRGAMLLTRDSNFGPNPPGTPILQNTLVNNYQLYFSDNWRMTPSFTFTYGLSWNVQMPPFETKGKDTMMIDNATGEILDLRTMLLRRLEAGLNGSTYNPELAFVPISAVNRKYPYDPQYANFGPRLAVAWNPSATEGFLGSLLGDRRSVIRAGYARTFDRVNGVGIVMTPALAIGFGNGVTCSGPRSTGVCGGLGANPGNAFRIGTDGTGLTMPGLSPIAGGRLIPGFTPNANSPYELLEFRIDPKRKVGVEEMWDLTIQRELGWNMLVEVGYVGRVGYHLSHGASINQIPYMMRRNGQSFADAFDAVAIALRAGQAPAPQPFFESLGAGTTAALASGFDFEFENALAFDVFSNIEGLLDPNGVLPIFNQIFSGSITTSDGRSSYNAGFITLRRRMSRGLNFQANYTLAKSLDYTGWNQENVVEAADAYNLRREWGPSFFDRRHTFNGFFMYELPFGRGRRFAVDSSALDRLVGGWQFSGILTLASGLPYDVWNSNSCQEFGAGAIFGNCVAMTRISGGPLKQNRQPAADDTQNAFANPSQVMGNFRPPLFSDLRTSRGSIRGQNRYQFDMGVGKSIPITERVSTKLELHIINLFNNPLLSDAGDSVSGNGNLDIANPSAFGRIGNGQFNSPRFLQLGLRIDF